MSFKWIINAGHELFPNSSFLWIIWILMFQTKSSFNIYKTSPLFGHYWLITNISFFRLIKEWWVPHSEESLRWQDHWQTWPEPSPRNHLGGRIQLVTYPKVSQNLLNTYSRESILLTIRRSLPLGTPRVIANSVRHQCLEVTKNCWLRSGRSWTSGQQSVRSKRSVRRNGPRLFRRVRILILRFHCVLK